MTESGTYDEILVRVSFHGPFRVGSGRPQPGSVRPVDRADPLPGSSLKGVMRASARQLLPTDHPLLDAVFGGDRKPSPWQWAGAVFAEGEPAVLPRAQVEIDGTTGTARTDHLVVGEENWARCAQFTVRRAGFVPPQDRADHAVLLACAAAGVHALGGGRRRGLGWVTCRPDTPAISPAVLEQFETIRGRCHRG